MSTEKGPFEVAEVVEYLEANDPHELMSWGDHLRGALAEVERLRALHEDELLAVADAGICAGWHAPKGADYPDRYAVIAQARKLVTP